MPARGTRRCWHCCHFRPLSDFFAPNGLELDMCRSCTVFSVDQDVADRRRRRYGVTALDYAAMLLAQHGQCAVCGDVAPLHIDHNHVTGKVRELVCRPCNTGMGQFKDDADRVYAAWLYLTYHED